MNGSSQRHSNRFGKSPPFLLPGLLVVIVILSFNYWRTSRLNKELIASVSVSQARSEKIDLDAKETAQEFEQKIKLLTQQQEDLRKTSNSDQKQLEAERAQLASTIEDKDDEIDDLKDDNSELKDEITKLQFEMQQLTSNLGVANQTIEACGLSNKALARDLRSQRTENYNIMMFIGEELGKEGIETLLMRSISLPENFTIPPANQQPLCYKRAEEECKTKMAKPVRVVSNEDNAPKMSPNAGREGVRHVDSEEGDVAKQPDANQQSMDSGSKAQQAAGNAQQVIDSVQQGADNAQRVVTVNQQDAVNGQAGSNLQQAGSNPQQGTVNPKYKSDNSQDGGDVLGNAGAADEELPQGPAEADKVDNNPADDRNNPADSTENDELDDKDQPMIDGDGTTKAINLEATETAASKVEDGYNIRNDEADYDDDYDEDEEDDDDDEYDDEQTYENPQVQKGTPRADDIQSEEEGGIDGGDSAQSRTTPVVILNSAKTTGVTVAPPIN